MSKITFGYEIEWGNIDKLKPIPEHLGYWEGGGSHAEVDIMNLIDGKWEPSYPNERWGGEINLTPTSLQQLVTNYTQLEELFPERTVSPVQEGHVHVRPDWVDNIDTVREFALFMHDNYQEIIDICLDIESIPSKLHSSVKRYLKFDIGGRINKTAVERIKSAESLVDFANIDRRGNTTMRFPRFFVNFRPLNLSSKTIEFRHFRMPTTQEQFRNQLIFVEGLLNKEIIPNLDLPKLDPYNLFKNQQYLDALQYWWDTREDRKKLGKKVRMEWKGRN